jgi:hypothetical protein
MAGMRMYRGRVLPMREGDHTRKDVVSVVACGTYMQERAGEFVAGEIVKSLLFRKGARFEKNPGC